MRCAGLENSANRVADPLLANHLRRCITTCTKQGLVAVGFRVESWVAVTEVALVLAALVAAVPVVPVEAVPQAWPRAERSKRGGLSS